MLISPFPAFVFCHKKNLEKNEQIKGISYTYLLANFVCSAVWLAYSFKVNNMDLIIINTVASIITAFFLIMYLYVKVMVG